MTTIEEVPRRTSDELRTIARSVITGEVFLTGDPAEIRSAFYMVLAFVTMSEEVAATVGAVFAPLSEVVPGRAMNGLPIFLSMAFLHRDDVPTLHEHLSQMRAALE